MKTGLATFSSSSPDAAPDLWRVVLYPLDSAPARAALSSLRARLHPDRIFDTLGDQLRELAQVRQPSARLEGRALTEAVEALRAGTPADAYGTWVYYPWSARLVRVLPKTEFRELRLSRNRNKITAAEQATLQRLKIAVVGLSVGQASAVTLAMEGVGGTFVLADFDALSLSNMNRVRAGVHDIGVNKAVLTARALYEIDPYLSVTVFADGVSDANVDDFLTGGGPADVLLEECDDLHFKLRIRERARALRIPVLMETSDRGMLDVERFDLDPARPLLHGRVDGVDVDTLRELSREDRVAVAMRIVGADTLSTRAAASALEVGSTLVSWPQLASAISLGAALNTDTVRRIALGEFTASGRYYVDLDRLVAEPTGLDVSAVDPRDVASQATPASARATVLDDAVRQIANAATLAPSGGNAQPWRLSWNGHRLRLEIDEARAGSLLDHDLRASHVALGAAVENAVLAAQALGLSAAVLPFPDSADRLAVCDLRFSRTAPGQAVDPLHAFVSDRCTNRRLGTGARLPAEAARELIRTAEAAGALLTLVDDGSGRARLGELLGHADRLRFLSKPLHAEFVRELRWTTEAAVHTGDGIDVRTLDLSATDLAGLRLCRSWGAMELLSAVGGGRNLEKFAHRAAAGAAAFGLLTVRGSTARDYFEGGRAMQRVWLAATRLGIGVQPMAVLGYLCMQGRSGGGPWTEPQRADLAQLEARYRAIAPVAEGHGEVMLLRFVIAPAPGTRSLRRPVDTILIAD